jgi:hypothetical protein
MSLVFERFEGGGNLMLLALALADHSNDAGESIHPSVRRLAQKTRQSERSVQRMLRQLEAMTWLQVVEAGSGRTHTTQYRINPAWIKGDRLAPFKAGKGDRLSPIAEGKGDKTDPERVTPEAVKGDRAVSPESSGIINRTSERQRGVDAVPGELTSAQGRIARRTKRNGNAKRAEKPSEQLRSDALKLRQSGMEPDAIAHALGQYGVTLDQVRDWVGFSAPLRKGTEGPPSEGST